MRVSITNRLFILFIFISSCVFTASTIWLYYHLEQSLVNQIRNELMVRHSLIDPVLSASSTRNDWQDVKDKLDILKDRDNRTQYWVISEDPAYSYGSSPVSPQWLNLKEGFSIIPQITGNHYWMIFTRNFPQHGERPDIRFVTASDCTPFFDTLNQFSGILMSTALIGILLISCLGYISTRISLNPLRRLSSQANALSPGKSQGRLDSSSMPCELKELASSFNGVLTRQEAAWRQLEGFNADVAHELKTPLTNMMGHTQVMLSHKRSAAELEELLASNLEEIERMSGIVNDMLFLSYAENGQKAHDLSLISLRDQCQKIIDFLESVIAEKQLQTHITGHVDAVIDKRLFNRAVGNIILNSLRYAKPNTIIEIAIEQEGEFAKVSVTNEGSPIPDNVKSHLFERFYRADSARSESCSHHGLGLSIVRAVAIMHGGSTFVSSQDNRNTFGLTMRLQPEPEADTEEKVTV